MKYLYKYPQAAYPYGDLVETNRSRNRDEMEYELIDTHIFDEDRYFDVVVEYAKAAPEDMPVRISATNRGPGAAALHLLPTIWFRHISGDEDSRPHLRSVISGGKSAVEATHGQLGTYFLYYEGQPLALFTNNETNEERIFGRPNASPYVKDAFHDYVIHLRSDAVNPTTSSTCKVTIKE